MDFIIGKAYDGTCECSECQKKTDMFLRINPYDPDSHVLYIPFTFRIGDAMIRYMCKDCIVDKMTESIVFQKAAGPKSDKIEPRSRNNYRLMQFIDHTYGEITLIWTANNFVHLESNGQPFKMEKFDRPDLALVEDPGMCMTFTAIGERYKRAVSKTAIRTDDMAQGVLCTLTKKAFTECLDQLYEEIKIVDQTPDDGWRKINRRIDHGT